MEPVEGAGNFKVILVTGATFSGFNMNQKCYAPPFPHTYMNHYYYCWYVVDIVYVWYRKHRRRFMAAAGERTWVGCSVIKSKRNAVCMMV